MPPIEHSSQSRTSRGALVGILWASCILLAIAVALVPVTFDTLHVTDTTFIAKVALWVKDGAVPGRDFNHFYGGAHEQVIAWSYGLFGIRIKALDLALVMEFTLAAAALLMLARNRLDHITTALVATVLAITFFARQPFEEYALMQELTAAHSFAYNRLGTALTILATLVVLVQPKTALARDAGAVIAGLCVALAVVAKSTFLPVILGLALGFILLGRYRELLLFTVAALVSMVALDPQGSRIISTFMYSVESSEGRAGLQSLIRKSFRLVGSQQAAVLSVIIVLGVLITSRVPQAKQLTLTSIVILGAFWASSVTMGPGGLAGHPGAPLMAAIGLFLWAQVRQNTPNVSNAAALQIGPITVLLWAAFTLPHGLNILGTTAKAWSNAQNAAFDTGPLSGYLAQYRGFRDTSGRELNYNSDRDAVVVETERRLREGRSTADTDYIRLAEAIRLTEDLPDLANTHLVSDTRLGLTFALNLPRTEGFPAWLRAASPELLERPLRNADLVLLDTTGRSPFTETLRQDMDDFILCKRSPLWHLYIRSTRDTLGCDAVEATN